MKKNQKKPKESKKERIRKEREESVCGKEFEDLKISQSNAADVSNQNTNE